MVLGPDGIALEDGSFESLVRPSKDISTFITSLTGITVKTASDFTAVATEFFQFMGDITQNHAAATASEIDDIILVAHNGRAFDVPFLMRSIVRHNLECLWGDSRFGFTIDTLHISKQLFQNKATRQPTNQKLGTLFQFLTGKEMENSHRAMSDAKALYSVFRSELFWTNRKESLQISIINGGPSEQAGVVICLHDSNVSDSSDSKDMDNRGRKRCWDDGNANSSDEDEEGNNPIAGDHWKKQDFIPTNNPSEIFLKHLLCRVGVESQELDCKCLRQWPTHPSKLGDLSLQLVFLRRLFATQINKCTVILRLSHTLPQKVNRPTKTALRQLKGNFEGKCANCALARMVGKQVG
jgi:inhibitor of KinA sporulation pathway (predicted exonuclease)